MITKAIAAKTSSRDSVNRENSPILPERVRHKGKEKMISKAIAILCLVVAGILFAHVILTKQPPKPAEYEDFGDYFFNQ